MEFVWIPALNLWVGKYEVTNLEYRAFVPLHGSGNYSGHSLDNDRQPVPGIGFGEAVAYASWLTERERPAGRLPHLLRYRLPSEREFLVYARCGDWRRFPWGDSWPPKYGNYAGLELRKLPAFADPEPFTAITIPTYNDGSMGTCLVRNSGRNDWGLHGIGGNLQEACAAGAGMPQSFGAWRGASWAGYGETALRCDTRTLRATPDTRGFRLLLAR